MPSRILGSSATTGLRLLGHTESLDVMGFPVADYLHIKTGGDYHQVGSLRDAYADLYKNCDNAEQALEEESLAIFVELVSHGVVDEADIAPVRDILDGIFSGRYAGKEDARKTELGVAHQSFQNLKAFVEQAAPQRAASRPAATPPAPIRRDMPPPGSGAADRMARLRGLEAPPLSPFEAGTTRCGCRMRSFTASSRPILMSRRTTGTSQAKASDRAFGIARSVLR